MAGAVIARPPSGLRPPAAPPSGSARRPRGRAAGPRAVADALDLAPRQQAQRQRIETAFGSTPAQRLVYFTDADGAQASTAKPPSYPYWESPLNGTDHTLHDTADGARGAAMAALNAAALTPLSEDPTEYGGGGPAANGRYEFWMDGTTGAVRGHPVHTQEVTNTLTKVTKAGKAPEKRITHKPVVHDHAADYGVPEAPSDDSRRGYRAVASSCHACLRAGHSGFRRRRGRRSAGHPPVPGAASEAHRESG